nr:protein Daple-like [Ipomoea batatas]
MVPAGRRLWMDSGSMEALSNHLAGGAMNLTMQALELHHRQQEAMREYTESEQARMALANDLSRSEERYGRVRAAHDVLHSDYTALREDYECLQAEHQTLQAQGKQREIDHVAAMQGAILDWRGTPDFVRATDELALTHMPLLLQSWLVTSNMSGQPMIDAMADWFDIQHFTVPPSIQIFQDWAISPGGRLAMGPIAETWLRDTDEGQARIVREGEAAFYLGKRHMQELLYAKLQRRFSSFSIAG